ncbi:uncharacterized protein LOC143127078 [Alosa pseudoharengus]|uniref:uncharacterized protein LOC143127078 n=1 Tax=Alosa pseudoharengus TaxID=34774 RepID=UPI003F8ABD3E
MALSHTLRPLAYTQASSGWQLMFLKEGQTSAELSLDEAREQGYRLHFTPGRVLLRMPYGKPLSHDSLVPIVTFPLSSHAGFESKNISIGVHGTLLDPQVTADRGYSLSIGKGMVDIGIPYGAEGGHRQSFVLHNTYLEFYLIYLYYECVFMDSFHTENRHRHTKVLMTQSLPHVPITINHPPSFSGLCQEHGIVFKLAHEEFHHMWDITIGNNLLTEQYAVRQGYLMANDSQGILLDVPLFTPGYLYEDIDLDQFFGTFEILSRDAKTQEIQQHSVKRCPFPTTELIVCSTGGVMTVVTSVVKSIPKADPQRTTLLDTTCKPKEMDETRVLFEFDLTTCGTRMKVKNDLMIFENTIMFEQEPFPSHRPVITRDTTFRLAVQCSYPVEAVNMDVAFASSVPGRGSVGEAKPYETALAKPIMLPAPEVVTTASVPITPRIKTPPTQRSAKFMRVRSHHSAKRQSS